MNILFHEDGHLSENAFELLVSDQPLDELERLELAEHLSFCDTCVEHYARLLAQTQLISPIQRCAPTVMHRLKEHTRKFFVSKYGAVLLAASFTFVLWGGGTFSVDAFSRGDSFYALSDSASEFLEKADALSTRITANINQFLNQLTFERSNIKYEEK